MKYELDRIYKNNYNNKKELLIITCIIILFVLIGILFNIIGGTKSLNVYVTWFSIIMVALLLILIISHLLNLKYLKIIREKNAMKNKTNFDNLLCEMRNCLKEEGIYNKECILKLLEEYKPRPIIDVMKTLGILGMYYTIINIFNNNIKFSSFTLFIILIVLPTFVGFTLFFIKDYLLTFINKDEIYYSRMHDALLKLLGECKKK